MTSNLSNPHSQRKQQDIENQKEMIKQDRDEMDTLRRFGYFTIPYPATVGDEAYSHINQKKNYQIIDGKIKTENRNIFVAPLKKGKGPDVYFSPVEPESQDTIDKYKAMNEVDKKNELKKVQQRKENKANITFKPAGPQETFSFYRDIQTPESTGTLYITPDPKRFIMEGQKVKTENRGIFTNPTKLGIPHPNDYFGFYFADEPTQERIKTLGEKDIKDKLDKVQILKKKLPTPRPPFSPASLKKCEPFSNNIETYGVYNEAEKEQKLKEYAEYKKKGNPKYSKSLPKGSVKHDKPFQPARLVYIGRDGLFDDNLYTLPEMTEKDKAKLKIKTVREKKEEEEKSKATKRVPFTYNKLMKISKFAPPISSFTTNLKKEFPTIKFH
jgi:hypothetical protein